MHCFVAGARLLAPLGEPMGELERLVLQGSILEPTGLLAAAITSARAKESVSFVPLQRAVGARQGGRAARVSR